MTKGRSFEAIFYPAAALLLVFSRLASVSADPDLFGYLSFGRYFFEQGAFPWQDPFSYLPTAASWIYHEWLTGIIYYKLYLLAGFGGLQVLKFLLGAGTAVLLYAAARKRGASRAWSAVCIILISPLFAIAFSPVRAQIFTSVFLALTLYVLASHKANRPLLCLVCLLPVNCLWVNMHGGFLAGMVVYLAFALQALLKRERASFYLWGLGIFLLCCLCTPYGPQYPGGIWRELVASRVDVPEWNSTFKMIQSSDYAAACLAFILVFLLTLVSAIISRSLQPAELILLLGAGAQGLLHIRHQAIFYVLAGAYLPILLESCWLRMRGSLPGLENSLLLSRAVPSDILLVSGFAVWKELQQTLLSISTREDYPVGALEYLRSNNIRGNLLTELDWGSYITWELYPAVKVAVDGRYATVFESGILKEFFAFVYARRGDAAFLSSYPHELSLMRRGSDGADLLLHSPGWESVYRDEKSELFRRQS